MTPRDPREAFLRALKLELRCARSVRRRVLREIADHLDDLVAELRASGFSELAAVQQALRRMGDPTKITTAFVEQRPDKLRRSGVRSLRSPAWIAVAAMSLVTAWAAELPQASGAKATARPTRVPTSHQLAPSDTRSPAQRAAAGSPRTSRVSIRPNGAFRSP